MVKKLVGPPGKFSAATSVHAITEKHTSGFFITDTISGCKFLVDTGAFKSIYPATPQDRNQLNTSSNIKLVAANNSEIAMYGSRTIHLVVGGRSFKWNFLIADVHTPLLGADFLGHYGLLVDVANQRWLDIDSFHTMPFETFRNVSNINTCTLTLAGSPYTQLIEQFPDVFKPELHQQVSQLAKHGICHHIRTTGPPLHSRFRRLSPHKLQAAKQSFAEMERMGICRKGSSPWASPLHMVPKEDGSWRPCGDYRRLNNATEPDHYPLPNMADLTSNLHGAKVFTKLDLLKGYFQIPVHPGDVDKTAIITPFGTYVFSYTTFGLRNAGATFQRMMDEILGNLPYCAYYVDDILVYSRNETEHLQHVGQVLKVLHDNELVLRSDKCQFAVSRVEFLGHEISAAGVRPLPGKVAAVKNFPTPSSIPDLQRFAGMVNYYHRFLPGIAQTMTPLYDALKGNQKKLNWTPDHQSAFDDAKKALVSAATLSFPIPNQPLYLITDASMSAVGAVVEQVVNSTRQPLGFFSKKLRPPEIKYSTFDRELLAVHLATRHFRHLLEGTPFTIRTDHRPLVHAFTKASDTWSARQQRHLSAIAEFGCTMEYLPGHSNPVADALSRIQIQSVHLGIDYNELSSAQIRDPEMAAYRTASTGLCWADVPVGDDGLTLLCDTSTGRPRPLIPQDLRRKVFDIVHGLAHPSGRSTAKLLKQKFVWHGINRDARNWSRHCISCQTSKVTRHTESGIGHFPQPKRRFGHIHVDIVGPLPPSEGANYLFTSTERSTRWPEAIPMSEATAQACAEALLHGWVSRFGVPDDITSDRGPAFISHLWTALGQLMGTTIHRTTAYNPAANGMVERTHRTLKAALMARCTGPDWKPQLPWILLGMRTTPKEGLDVSPAEMVYGETIAVPGEFFPSSPDSAGDINLDNLRRSVGRFRPCHQTCKNERNTYIPRTLPTSEHVFVRNDAHRTPLTRPYRGPYLVVERTEKAYRLNINGRLDWVSVDRLKPAYLDSDEPAVSTSRAGRTIRAPNRLTYY